MRRWFAGPARLWAQSGVLAAAISLGLGLLARRGSWYADDLDFMIHGSSGFGAAALLTPVNDHIAPGLRLMYAVFATVAPLSYDVTVAWRVLMWAAAMMLMAGLLWRLTRRGGLTLVGVALYGLSSLAMPSFMSLSSAVNNLPAHVLGLAFVHLTLDWFEGGSGRSIVGVALALGASLVFWEKSGLIVLTAVAVVAVALGPRALVSRRAAGWLVGAGVPVAAFAVLYLSRRSAPDSGWPGTETTLGLVGEGLVSVLAPGVVGGPWAWGPTSPPYFGLATPPTWVVATSLVVCAALVVAAAATRRAVLWLWAACVLYSAIGVSVVALGRFSTFGSVVAHHHHYWSDGAIPLTLALVCSLSGLRLVHRPATLNLVAGLAASLWAIGTVASFTGFAQLWGANPAGSYLAALREDAGRDGGVNVWNTRPSLDVMPYISNNRSVGHLLGLAGTGAQVQASSSEPEIVDTNGRIVPASFTTWADTEIPPDCGLTLRGRQEVVLPLRRPVPEGEWFVRVGYLSNPEAAVEVTLNGSKGSTPARPATPWPAGLSTANLGVDELVDATSVTLRSTSDATNVCIGSVMVGLPEVAR
jgi:hypothetical protein